MSIKYIMKGRGVAIISCSKDWERAAQHLWGLGAEDFRKFKQGYREPEQQTKANPYQEVGAQLLSQLLRSGVRVKTEQKTD